MIEQAFLDDIIAHPSDDAVRLIYADWLEEQGQEDRAEFVRAQMHAESIKGGGCALVLKKDCDGSRGWCLRCQSIRKAGMLLDDHQEWCSMPDHEDRVSMTACEARFDGLAGTTRILFCRGFIAAVRCPLQAWLDHGPAICAAHPVEKVELSDRKPSRAGLIVGIPVGSRGWCNMGTKAAPYMATFDLPGDVWQALPLPVGGVRGNYKHAEHEAMADDALSRALLVAARTKAVAA